MKKLIFILFITMVLGTGCKKFLEATPQDFVTPGNFFTKEADAVATLNSAFDMMTRQFFYSGYYQYRMLAQDDVWCPFNAGYPATLSITAAESAHIPPMWNNIYTAIQYTNVLLDNLSRVDMDETRKGEIKGEALFFRAYCYFLLVDHWGTVPLKLKPTAGPNDINYAGTPIKDMYAQILKDMTEAEGLVPTTAKVAYGGAGYPAKTTVQGILARVCLTMAGEPLKDVSKYQEAKNWAQKVVDSKEHALNPDYTDIFIRMANGTFDKKESMWEVDFNDIIGSSTEHGYIGYLNGIPGAAASFGNSVGQVRVTRKLFELYGATTNDLRRDWNCATFGYKNTTTTGAESDKTYWTITQTDYRYDGKFRLEYTPGIKVVGRSAINFPLLRYADVLLMLAEADNAINGPTNLAYDLVDQVRARAYGKLKGGATNLTEANVSRTQTKESFLKLIQDERCRELSGEALRRHDLIRWGIFVSTMKELKADADNTAKPPLQNAAIMRQLGNNVSQRDVLWPIPATELTFNKLMKQNPGW